MVAVNILVLGRAECHDRHRVEHTLLTARQRVAELPELFEKHLTLVLARNRHLGHVASWPLGCDIGKRAGAYAPARTPYLTSITARRSPPGRPGKPGPTASRPTYRRSQSGRSSGPCRR